MRKSLGTLLIGLVLGAGSMILGSLYAQDNPQNRENRADLIGQLDRIIKTYCDVYVSRGARNTSNHCRRNEVMTGLDAKGLYCAPITVECFGKQIILAPNDN